MADFLKTVKSHTKYNNLKSTKKNKLTNLQEQEDSQKISKSKINEDEEDEEDKVFIDGNNVPLIIKTFKDIFKKYSIYEKYLDILCKSIEENGFGFTKPTLIQKYVIPSLCTYRDVLAFSSTGTGKTFSYAIPMLHILRSSDILHKEDISNTKNIENKNSIDNEVESKDEENIIHIPYWGCIIIPTNEQIQQTQEIFSILIKEDAEWNIDVQTNTLIDTVLHNRDTNILKKKYPNRSILLTTPQKQTKLLKKIIKKNCDPQKYLKIQILDEADQLMSSSTIQDINTIQEYIPKINIVKFLCSATINSNLEILCKTIMKDPIRIIIGEKNMAQMYVQQCLQFVGTQEGKFFALNTLIKNGQNVPVLIFVQSKDRAIQLYKLLEDNFSYICPGILHSNCTMQERDKVIKEFRKGKILVLVCTDILSRGMDFRHVNMVINYDCPTTSTIYIHRKLLITIYIHICTYIYIY